MIGICHRCHNLDWSVDPNHPACARTGEYFMVQVNKRECPIGSFVIGPPAEIEPDYDPKTEAEKGKCGC
jgi:hypothetical protein